MPDLIAIAFSDLHIHRWKNYNLKPNGRLIECTMVLKELAFVARKNDVPLLFCGDWYHTNREVDTLTHSLSMKVYHNHLRSMDVYAISGNHDLSERNGPDHRSPSHLDAYSSVFPRFIFMDYKHGEHNRFMIWGLPYMDNEKELFDAIEELKPRVKEIKTKKLKILMLHTDLPGARTPSGHEVGDMTYIKGNLDDYFEPWDLVICGHIHKPMALGNRVVMLGAPLHQDAGDEGTQMGYWEIYNDGTHKFIPLYYPQFKTGEEKNDGNYWVNKEVVLVEEEVEIGEFHINNSRKKLATQYLKKKGIKSKAKKRALIEILNSIE
jgi:DNA repair exonuclease SbcCD nuclease subunit